MKTNNNSIVHFELPVDDVKRAQDFYGQIFGWEFNTFDMPSGEPYYGVRTTEVDDKFQPKNPGTINGGMMKRANPGQVFTNYINVESIDDVLAKVTNMGGKVMMPKSEIAPGMGWIALFQDTEGNMMGLHQMSQHMQDNS